MATKLQTKYLPISLRKATQTARKMTPIILQYKTNRICWRMPIHQQLRRKKDIWRIGLLGVLVEISCQFQRMKLNKIPLMKFYHPIHNNLSLISQLYQMDNNIKQWLLIVVISYVRILKNFRIEFRAASMPVNSFPHHKIAFKLHNLISNCSCKTKLNHHPHLPYLNKLMLLHHKIKSSNKKIFKDCNLNKNYQI